MYQQSISRQDPGCFIFVLDRSDSMRRPWAGTGMSLAQGAALAVNKILLELCIKSTKQPGVPMRDYFFVGCYGYGLRPSDGSEGVESALPGGLGPRGIVPLSQLAPAFVGVQEQSAVDPALGSSRLPIWITPEHGWRTPMCEALALVCDHVYQWSTAFPSSSPPCVIHITDGIVTDSPYQGASLGEWARRLTSIGTADGPVLLLNIFLSPSTAPVVSYPASAAGLPEPGPGLFSISSPLPPSMVANARAAQVPVPDGARGFVFNADLVTLLSFLEIGTRVTIRDA